MYADLSHEDLTPRAENRSTDLIFPQRYSPIVYADVENINERMEMKKMRRSSARNDK